MSRRSLEVVDREDSQSIEAVGSLKGFKREVVKLEVKTFLSDEPVRSRTTTAPEPSKTPEL